MIKIFPTIQIKELDAYTIENEPIASIDLMERASQALAKAISERWGAETPFTVFAGPGNNGGDALAVSRLLAEQGYRVEVYLFNTKGTLSPDCETNKERLARVSGIDFHEITTQFVPPVLTAEHVVVDGLFGSGLNKPLSGGFAAVVKYINSSPATVVAIDVPSGLMGEDNTYNIQANIIRADLTLSLQLPKLAFLFAENEPFVGEWQLLDIGLSEEAITEKETDFALTEHEDMASVLKPRGRFAHKGSFGRALLIAGSQGMAGASVLAARACLRSGVGLLTVHIPFCNNFIVQTAVPEAMTEIDINDVRFSCATDTDDYQAVGIGPGLGRAEDTEAALLDQIEVNKYPDGAVDEQVKQANDYYTQIAQMYGVELSDFITTYLKMTEDQFNKKIEDSAKQAVQLEEAVKLIAKKEKLEPSDKEYKEGMQEYADKAGADLDTYKEQVGEDVLKDAILRDKVLDYLVDNSVQVEQSDNN